MLQIDLSHKVAVLTGASGQLGRVMARTLARSGADLILHYFNDETSINQVMLDVMALGRRAVCVTGDVGSEAGVTAIAFSPYVGDNPTLMLFV